MCWLPALMSSRRQLPTATARYSTPLMVKILALQQLYNLTDCAVEFQLLDCRRFLRLNLMKISVGILKLTGQSQLRIIGEVLSGFLRPRIGKQASSQDVIFASMKYSPNIT